MIDLTNWRKLQRHPLSEMFGDMDEVTFEAVVADMADHGFDERERISVYEGKVLDGWHRQRAAILSHKTPSYTEYKGDNPLDFVKRKNFNRRHYDTSQRALIAGKLANYKHGGDRRSVQVPSLPLEKVAAELNVSLRAARHGKKVSDHGVDELQKAVSDGTVSISDAAAVASQPASEQRRAVQSVRSGKTTTARAAVPKEPAPPREHKSKPITDTRLRNLVKAADSLLEEAEVDAIVERSKALAEAVRALALDLLSHPTQDEVADYCKERGGKVNAVQWFSYYEANGWQVGKQRMKDWRACVRYWEQNAKPNGKPAPNGETAAERWAKSKRAGK